MNRFGILAIIVLSLLVACQSAPSFTPIAVIVTPEPTTIPTEEPVLSAAEAQLVFGNQVFHTMNESGFACVTCHYTSERRLLGPGLANIEERAFEYNPDDDIVVYIRNSIIAPTDFITPADPAFPENLMPRNYADLLSNEEIDALVVYILSL